MTRPLAISLSPNTEKEDVLKALSAIVSPWSYNSGKALYRLEEWFKNFFRVSHAASFNSGRSALFVILTSLGIGDKDEVLLQAFTCVAVPNAIIWVGAKPIYVDTTDSLTIDPLDLKKKITQKTKAIIVQHTFGIPSKIEEILRIAKTENIPVIEDCAHLIGGTLHNKKLGTFGDAAIFSFGRDKALSSVFGGMAITNEAELGQKIKQYQQRVEYPAKRWTAQQLFHPIAFSLILKFYNIGLGKFLLAFLQKIHFLSLPVTAEEKKSNLAALFVKKMPNALCALALLQLKKLEKYNKKREEISKLYISELQNFEMPYKELIPYLRFPLIAKNRDQLLKEFKKRKMYLGKWYSEIIDPKGVDLQKAEYTEGSCKNAERLASTIINLPTYPLMDTQQAKEIINITKSYAAA